MFSRYALAARWRRHVSSREWWLPFRSFLLFSWPALAVGVVSVAILQGQSAHHFGSWASSGTREAFWILAGIGIGGWAAQISFRWWLRQAVPLFCVGLLASAAVLFFGAEVNGSRAWFDFGIFNAQPVEFLKIGLVAVLARLYSQTTALKGSWWVIIAGTVFFGMAAGLVLLQPDLGSALVLGAVWFLMTAMRGLSPRQWLAGAGALLFVLFVSWSFLLKDYQKDRIVSYVSPDRDSRGASYNVRQALVALGSGGWFGYGIGNGPQTQLQFLPVRQTDFIYAVIGEELGFVGAGGVLLLLTVLMARVLVLALRARDDAPAYLSLGIFAVFFVHTAINVGMNLGLVPVTGLPLPFVSYGGSSTLAFWFLLGLAGNMAYQQRHRSLRSSDQGKDVDHVALS